MSNGPSVIIPPGPYLYDDPRFVYNEPCMFYDGGFDVQCLIDRQRVVLPKRVGRSGARPQRRRPKPLKKDCRIVLDFKIKSEIYRANDEIVDDEGTEKKYHLEYDPINVYVDELKFRYSDKEPYKVVADILTSSNDLLRVCEIDRVKLIPIKTIVSSSLEVRLRKSKALIKGEVVSRKKKLL